MPRHYRTPEAAEYLGCSEPFLNKSRPAGTGPAFRRVGRSVVYDESDLVEFKRVTRVEPRHTDTEINKRV
jgi:predicted DNA-binding transcriptional regulator AlpA